MSDQPGANPLTPPSERKFTDGQKEAIRRQLDRILESPAFGTSKRSQQCLRYMVEKALEGDLGALKERCIGVEVFGRSPDYDSSADAVVRSRANELRKRLAQYHDLAGPNELVRIDLPPGSYLPEFHFHPVPPVGAAEGPSPSPLVQRSRRPWLYVAGAALLVTSGVWLGAWYFRRPVSMLQQFWAPVLQSPRQVLIVPGSPVGYLLSRRIHKLYDAANSPEVESGPHVVHFGLASIPGADIIPCEDQWTGLADAVMLGRLMEMFGRLGKPCQIRFARDTSFANLRNSPNVLISAFSNRWNLDMGRALRFSFEWRDHVKMISDKAPPGRSWCTQMDAIGHTQLDYALICRVFDTTTGEPIVMAGGSAQSGTQAASDFLTNNVYWERLARQVPRDWLSRNLQVVISTKVIGNTPTSPEIVAVHCW